MTPTSLRLQRSWMLSAGLRHRSLDLGRASRAEKFWKASSCPAGNAAQPAQPKPQPFETAAPAVQDMHRSQTMDIIAYAMTALIAFTVSGVSIVRIARGEQSFTLLVSKSSG